MMLLNAMLSNSNVEKTKNALTAIFFSAKTSNSVSNILNPDFSILSEIDDFHVIFQAT